MTLLKGDKSVSKKAIFENVNLTVKDGWNFGIGFGLAMTIALPIILLLISCIIGIGIMSLGSSFNSLLGGW
jgi:hypothetical protein